MCVASTLVRPASASGVLVNAARGAARVYQGAVNALHYSAGEFFTAGPNTFNENETIAKYEIMDGAPVKGT